MAFNLHPVVRWLARRSTSWFYRDAEFVNASAIPKSGATLLVASHPNDLPDILLTFLASNRDLLFVANIAAADLPFVRWTYAGLGVIPVSRVRDARALKARGENAGAINAHAFVRVVDALKQGHAVAIFPEGIVPDYPRLGALRSGAAKMALLAIDAGVTSLTMVPIGYQYECAHEVRSGALGVVAQPIAVEQWRPIDATKRVTEFTALIASELCKVTRNARTQHDAEVLSFIAAAAGAVLSAPSENPMIKAYEVQRRLSCLSAADEIFVADAFAPAAVEQREQIEKFESDALALSAAASVVGAQRWSARDIADVLESVGEQAARPRTINVLPLLLLSPVAAVGWLWHAFPWWLSRAIANRFAPRQTELAAITLVPGLYVMVVWYLLAPLLLFAFGARWWLVLIAFVLQPRLGDQAMSWRDRVHTWRLKRSAQSISTIDRQSLRNLCHSVRASWGNLP